MVIKVQCRNSFLSVVEDEPVLARRPRALSEPLLEDTSATNRSSTVSFVGLEDALENPEEALASMTRSRASSVAMTEDEWSAEYRSPLMEPLNHGDTVVLQSAEQTTACEGQKVVLESASTASGATPPLGMSPVSSSDDVHGLQMLLPPPPSQPPLSFRRAAGEFPQAQGPAGEYGGSADWEDQHRTSQLAHSRVPKPKNLKELYGQAVNGFTTIMVRNLPNRYKQRDFVEELLLLGLPAGTWDFLYVPVDTHTNSSVGYAFVNFVNSEIAQHAMRSFDGYRWRRFRKQTSKPAAVNKAHIQGLANNLDHFSRTAIKDAKVKQHRPLVLAGAPELPSWFAPVDREWTPPSPGQGCYFVSVAQF